MATPRDRLQADAVQAFGVFAEHLNFTAAAAALHLSQPSLHAKIRQLQRGLGVDLYERDGRGLRLTASGRRLAVFARDAGRRADDLLATLGVQSSPLVIAAGRAAFRWVVGDGVRRLARTGRPVRVVTADRDTAVAAVRSGEVDLAVMAQDPPPNPLRSRLVGSYPQTLLVPQDHPLASRRDLTVGELTGLELIVPPPERGHRRALDRALLDAGATWSVAAEVDGWDLMVHFAALGLGVTVVNGCVPPPPGLVAVPVVDLAVVHYWAVWRTERDDLVRSALGLMFPEPEGSPDE